MAHGGHPDFRLVPPVDKDGSVDRLDGSLRSEQAGAVVHEVALRPMEGRYRVFLLQDIHLAQPAFANKLLKTLEEPPPQVVLLLTAVDRSGVLSTIVSRCQNLELRPLDLPTLEDALRTIWGATVEQSQLLARLSNGRLGWAVEQLQQPERWEQRRDQLQTLWRMMAADRIERLAFAETIAANRNSRQLFGMLELWVSWWRDLLLAQSGCADACSNIDHQAEIEHQARVLDSAAVKDFLRTLQRSEEYLHHTVNTRLAVDVLMLKLPVMTS